MSKVPVSDPRSDTLLATTAVTVRYFAAARAATGKDEDGMTFSAPTTVGDVLAAATERHGEGLEKVLPRCSYLRNGVAVHELAEAVLDGDQLDVLPPFAGG